MQEIGKNERVNILEFHQAVLLLLWYDKMWLKYFNFHHVAHFNNALVALRLIYVINIHKCCIITSIHFAITFAASRVCLQIVLVQEKQRVCRGKIAVVSLLIDCFLNLSLF